MRLLSILSPDSEIATFAERPTPAVTSGKITKVAKVNGTWLIWFNGEPAYCCTHGANGQPAGCPTYTYVNTSTVNADQCIPGDHYGNQIRIWGGLNQLSLGDADDLPAVFPLTRVKKSLFWISAHQFMTMCKCILSKTSLKAPPRKLSCLCR